MTDHKELRRLAAAATQGNWGICPETDGTELVAYEVPWKVLAVVCKMPLYPGTNNWYANFAFISKANPKAVTALLDELAESKSQYLERHISAANTEQALAGRLEKAEAERDQLIKAASCIRHWADTHFNKATGETEGMVVSATHVRDLWAVLEALTTPLPAAATFGDNDPGPGPHVDGQSPEWKAAHILPRAPADSVQVRTPGTCHHYIKSGFGGYRCGLGERFHDPADCVIDDCPIRPNQDPSP